MSPLMRSAFFLIAAAAHAQPVEVIPVRSQTIDRTVTLPGEILPFQRVTLHARVNGYVERVLVDRGSSVRQGNLLVSISAPEIAAEVAQSESRAQTAESARAEAVARLAATQATYERLKRAASTPGAVAGNEVIQAEKIVDAARASVQSAESAVRAAQAAVRVSKQSEQYLQVTAPFSGTITERYVHPGALVGPGNGSAGALLELEQVSMLRLVVAVPEADIAGIRRGVRANFRVPAYPNRTFSGTVARIDRSLDPKTRTMAVELDVVNSRNELSPGMFPEIAWPSQGAEKSLLVPATAIVTTTERTFVIQVVSGRARWVNIRKGNPAGELVEIFGPLHAGELVVRRASDEIRDGAQIQVSR